MRISDWSSDVCPSDLFGVRAFHPHYRYSCQHSHFRYLQRTSQSTFTGLRNAPLPRIPQYAPQASVYRLAPLNLPRRPTRPVSYSALFKGWLLLSQPPGCLCLSARKRVVEGKSVAVRCSLGGSLIIK